VSILITSKSRENILSKIRKGLGEEPLPLPFPEAEKESLKIYGNISVDVIELFAENFIKLGGNSFVIDYYPVKPMAEDYIAIILLVVVIAVAAGWIPARKASARLFEKIS
jgi:ABC-type antimicrobial peptide transport system permease subunit